jgi:hypothetical protein
MRTPLTLLAVALLSSSACSGGDSKVPTEAPPTDKAAAEPPNTEPPAPAPTLSLDELNKTAENTQLVPSPVEMQRALEKAGIAEGLDKLVTERSMKLDVENKDIVSVRTGVILADALLTVKSAPSEKLVGRLGTVKTGLMSLGAGNDLPTVIDDLVAKINNQGISRDDLVKELDDLHGAIIPEIRYEAGERCVPLIQAGSWLEGSNLVAAAVVAANKPEAGDKLLRQPLVVDYFLKYVKVEGAGKADAAVLKQLETTLMKLKDIASKPSLTIDDIKEVKTQTDAVLALL